MKFQTMAADKLPPRASFGKEPVYSPEEVSDAMKQLKSGVAISDGQDYATRQAAHNRAGVLRARLAKLDKAVATGSTTIANDGKWRWWIVATKNRPEVETIETTVTKRVKRT